MNHIANYLKKLTIENFQSHVKTTIEPAPPGQLTIVTGPSDSGKTALLRALRWLYVNEPDGDSFIRIGATFARVTTEHEGVGSEGNNSVVVRYRTSGGTNRYLVNGEKYEGFGRGGVPLEVKEITGVHPVRIGDLEFNLNIAEQLSGPFLGSSVSAPARAKVLGKLAGTEEIDYANRLLGTDLYRRNQDEKRLTADVMSLETEIKKFDWLPDAAQKIETLKGLVTKIKSGRERQMNLEHKRDKYDITQQNIYECLIKIERWKGLEQAESLLFATKRKKQLSASINVLVDRFEEVLKNIHCTKSKLARWRNLLPAEKLLQGAQTRSQVVQQLRSLGNNYLASLKVIRGSQETINSLQGLETAEALLQDVSEKEHSRKELGALSARWTTANTAVIDTQRQLNLLSRIDDAGIRVAQITGSQAQWARLCVLKNQYGNLLDRIDKVQGQAVLWENRVSELQGAYHDLLQDVGICPLCGQEIKSKVKEAV